MQNELVQVAELIRESGLSIAALLGRAEFVLKEGVVLGADNGEVVAHDGRGSFAKPARRKRRIGGALCCVNYHRRQRSQLKLVSSGVLPLLLQAGRVCASVQREPQLFRSTVAASGQLHTARLKSFRRHLHQASIESCANTSPRTRKKKRLDTAEKVRIEETDPPCLARSE